jgi:hypothetical protein
MAISQRANNSSTSISNFAMVLQKALNPYGNHNLRVPFYLTSSYRQKNKIPGVSMAINPSSVNFSCAKRITRKNTQGGAVFYHWTNSAGRNNDILEMEFVGKTGNVNLRTGTITGGIYSHFQPQMQGRGPLNWLNQRSKDALDSSDDDPVSVKIRGNDYTVSGAKKLASFWNLYSLTREPVVDPLDGSPVYYYISYSSPLFGNTFVTFIGFFSRGMSFTDDSENPFSKDYDFGFTVQASIPSLDNIYNNVLENLRTVFTNPL